MDDQAGHVIGHASLGLKQVHDTSGTKILVSTTVTTGFHLVTIWGTDHQVGNALAAISKRMAHRHLCSPNKKAKKVKAPSSGNSTTTTPPPPVITIILPSPTLVMTTTPSTRFQPSSRPPSHLPSSMELSTPSLLSTPAEYHGVPLVWSPLGSPMVITLPGTPMDIGASQEEYLYQDLTPVTLPQHGSRPTARCSCPYGSGLGHG